MLIKSKKNFITIFSGFLLSITLFCPQVEASAFTGITDILKTDSNYEIYTDIVNHGALTLNELGQFRPKEPINKAAFFKASMTYLGYIPKEGINTFTGYSDVPENSWFAPYIRKALEIRAITNVLNEEFHPEYNLTRQEALVLVLRIYGIPTPLSTPESTDLFSDIRENHPIAPVYAAAKSHGIFIENNREDFRPNMILTRGDAAILLFKAKRASAEYSDTQTGYGTITVVSPSLTLTEQDLLENEKFGILVDTWSKIHTSFLYKNNVNNNELIYGAIGGMVESLDDPYSTFHSPDQEGASYVYIPENYEGIGAVIEKINNEYVVVTTINNSPAYRSGLKSHDVIVEIDGKLLTNKTYEEVLGLIKGKSGTLVKMKVRRDTSLLTFEIIREKITVDSIQSKIVGNDINLIRIDQFTESSADEFKNIINQISANSSSRKIIIDVRNNPGGYLSSTKAILEYFLESGRIEFITQDKDGKQIKYFAQNQATLQDWKTVVLINEGSASAAEIFAGALQDYNLAEIIGTKSFGKGSVQEITNYNDNSSLKLTIAKWLTSLGRDIDHIGLLPDQIVTISDSQRQAGQDPQLEAAIKHLN